MPNALTISSHSRASLAFRLRRNRSALAGPITLFSLILTGLIALPWSIRWFNVQALDIAIRRAPSISPVVPLSRYVLPRSLKLADEQAPGAASRFAHRFTSLLGHDDLGRSLFFRLLLGFLISLGIGLSAAAMTIVIGSLWGSVAALSGGLIDWFMMRVVDVLYGLPYILMVILMRIALTPMLTRLFGGQSRLAGIAILMLAIGSVSWLTMARVVRGQVLSLRNQTFVEAARASGAGSWHILRRHILPNLIGPIIVYATLAVPQAIMQESFLSFLGIGVQQPIPSLGRLAADGVQAVNTFVGFWWLIVFPCGVLVLTLLSLNFIGDALRDAFDPRSTATTLV